MKIYFYNGFGAPKLLATSLDEFKKDVTISNSYLGDTTEQAIEDLEFAIELNLSNEEIGFNLYIDPTLDDFREVNRSYNLPQDTYLTDWL